MSLNWLRVFLPHWLGFFGINEGELLDRGLPISRLQPFTHVSDRPPKAPVIRGQLIQRGSDKKKKTGVGEKEEKEV